MNNTVYRKVNINKWLINNEKVLNILPNKNKNENNRFARFCWIGKIKMFDNDQVE